ncbi:MAG: ThiF family adenylyltransferase [Selenomonadaceae bacterium]|nr:ThiF family adenylyltransferase [Selenomonadaceae bacterium]
MNERFARTIKLVGEEGLKKLLSSYVAVFGVGGVGSFAAEALARSGVGHIAIVDGDTVAMSNMNRQLLATVKTLGMQKTEAMEQRINDIAPDAKVTKFQGTYPNIDIDLTEFDFIIDAIDDVKAKVELIVSAKARQIPIISCMGAGNKLYPELFEIADIFKTSEDPLARVMRKKLKERGIKNLSVVYSRERQKKK